MSIYESIGGEPALVEVVNGLYRRILLDPDLGPYFALADLDRLKARQVEFLGRAFGGPVEYRGGSMKDVHARRHLEQRHFAKFAEHLAASLAAAGVPNGTIEDILTLLAPLADDIVTGPPEPGEGALTGF